MNTFGRHLLVDYRGCLAERLDDQNFVEALTERAAKAAGATIVQSAFHRFSPQGVSGVVVILSRSRSVKRHDQSSGRGPIAVTGVTT